ncbi:hypothetical protein KH5H1_16670 [Corallococcus caeni]|uniref:Uncharacterized protein n=1 Tax=Corallococcus exercitus TaxID=2316736 RepID=A0A7Y4JVV2_9BACT|nr:hypothetical protein [Corallococcus exercitus]NOK12111.1 hypothetical protein [Corallococcus exercitus]GMT97548.1 hypothetical protein KH5H1_16670 [Corallococcus sp. KH5-1]
MKNCRSSADQSPGKDMRQSDLPDKPPPGPAGLDASSVAPARAPDDEPKNDLPDKPPPGTAGLAR